MDDKPWWWPILADAAWASEIREEYPEKCDGLDDDDVRDEFAYGWKYSDTHDHLGDARAQLEKLAGAFLYLVEVHGLKPGDFSDF